MKSRESGNAIVVNHYDFAPTLFLRQGRRAKQQTADGCVRGGPERTVGCRGLGQTMARKSDLNLNAGV